MCRRPAPRGEDRGVCADHRELAVLKIEQRGAGAARRERRSAVRASAGVRTSTRFVQNGLPDHAHEFEAGVIAMRQQPRRRGPPGCAQQPAADLVGSALFEVEIHALIYEPADCSGAIANHCGDQLAVGPEMTGAQGVVEMPLQRVILADGGLDAALRHHRIPVAHAQLGRKDDTRAVARRRQGRHAASPAGPDHKNVGRPGQRPGYVDVLDQRVRLQQIGQRARATRPAAGRS